MKRLALAVVLAACGGDPPKPATLPIAETQPEPPATPAPAPAPVPPPEPEKPRPPKTLDLAIPAATATVKLLSAGRGKKAKLVVAPKVGDKQRVELAMDFAAAQGTGTSQVLPTMVLSGDAEVRTADASGVTYGVIVTGIDARDVPGAKIPAAQMKQVLETLAGLAIEGSVAPNGTAGPIGMHLTTSDPVAESALQLVRLAIPSWPVLPAEPIGVGAKWQVTTTTRVVDKVEVSLVTTYELTAHEGAAWTIKGTAKVSGADQTIAGGKVTDISGSGTIDATLTDGALYPVYKSSIETKFNATEAGRDKAEPYDLVAAGAIAIK